MTALETIAPKTRILTTAKGRSVETWLTDQEAKDMLKTIPNLGEFGQSLLRRIRNDEKLSTDQMIWVHILVVEHENKKNVAPKAKVVVGDMKKVIDMFNHAKQHLKYPRIWLKVDGVKIRLSLAGPKSKYEGAVQIIADTGAPEREWLGRVSPDGEFVQGRATLPNLKTFLIAFATDPLMIAKEYGMLTGSCCFCNRTLTDERSVEVGYGPVCAKHYGLVWGN